MGTHNNLMRAGSLRTTFVTQYKFLHTLCNINLSSTQNITYNDRNQQKLAKGDYTHSNTMTPKKIKSFKWNIYWILESNIKQCKGNDQGKWRPVIVISSDIVRFHNQWLVVECSSHKLDEHSVLMEKYVDSNGNNRESWALPNRVHTLNSHVFKFDKKWYKPVPKEIRLKLIRKFYEVLAPEISNFFLSANSDAVSDVANINVLKKNTNMNKTNNINEQREIINCNFDIINNVNTKILEGNKNIMTGSVALSKGNFNILSGDIKVVSGNYNTIISDTVETVTGNFNKIFGKPKNITGNYNKYIECANVVGHRNRKI